MFQLYLSWIIVYTNCIFSLYAFPFTHFEDDNECDYDLITSSSIFNTHLSSFFNSFSTFVIFNNSASSSYLRLCSLLCASFSLVIHYSFSIALSTLILLWTPKIWKHTTSNNKRKLLWIITPFFLILEHHARHIHFFICPSSFNYCMILEINTAHHYKFMCPLYNQVEAFNIINMNEHRKLHLRIIPHP